MSDTPPAARTGGAAERMTINLTGKTADALADVVDIARETKTDAVNKAIQVYALLHKAQEAGGAVYLKESIDAELERLRLL